MADDSKDVPMYSANYVQLSLGTDELVIELRRLLPKFQAQPTPSTAVPGLTMMGAYSAQEALAVTPMARVALTFSAVRALKDFLDKAFPAKSDERKKGQ
jgi:hypothetical protein